LTPENASIPVRKMGLCPRCAALRARSFYVRAGARTCINCGALFFPNRGKGLPGKGRPRLRCYDCRRASSTRSELDLLVTLTDAQLEAIAHRVAELLAEGRASEPAAELLTVSQAAELAGVTRKTIANWLSAGRLRRHGVARRPRVSRVEVEALLAPQRPQAEPSSRRGKPTAPTGQFARILIGD